MADDKTADIRKFIIDHFSDEELTTFCFDYFRDVYKDFTTGMSKTAKAQHLIERCVWRKTLPNLLTALQNERPEQYDAKLDKLVINGQTAADKSLLEKGAGAERFSGDDAPILTFVYDGFELRSKDLLVKLRGTLWNTGNAMVSISSVTIKVISRRGRPQFAAVVRSITDAIEITLNQTQFTSFFTDDKVLQIAVNSTESITIPVLLPRLYFGKIAWILAFDGSCMGKEIHFVSELVFVASINDYERCGYVDIDARTRDDILKSAYEFPYLSINEFYQWLLTCDETELVPETAVVGQIPSLPPPHTRWEDLFLAYRLFSDDPKFARLKETLDQRYGVDSRNSKNTPRRKPRWLWWTHLLGH